MNYLSIIWYITTALAIVGFFVVMNFKDTSASNTAEPETPQSLTPSPSYKNFAPPSYESVFTKEIFIISIDENIRQANSIDTVINI